MNNPLSLSHFYPYDNFLKKEYGKVAGDSLEQAGFLEE